MHSSLPRAAATVVAAALCALVFAVAAPAARAQNCPQNKTCFYVPPQMPSPPHPVTWELVLSAASGPVTGTYAFGGGTATAFTAQVGSPVVVPLSDSAAHGVASGYNVKEQRGVFVVADSAGLSVVAREITGPWNSSASIKDHNTALGTRFRVSGYGLDAVSGAGTGHDVLMLYAPLGATVTVTPPAGLQWDDGLSGTLTVTLTAQQTILLRTLESGCGFDLTGALVTSDQPIAVVSGGRGWGTSPTCTPNGATACGDDGLDNIIPTTGLGTLYAIDAYPADNGDRVSIVADTAGTTVTLTTASGTTSAGPLAAGGIHRFQVRELTLIQTSAPAYVFQEDGQSNCEHGLSVIPPLTFSSSAATGYVAFNVFGTGEVSVFLPTANAASVLLDGGAPAGATSVLVPGLPTSGPGSVTRVRIPGLSGNHYVSATGDFQLGLVSESTAAGGTGLFAYYNRFRVPGCGDGVLDDSEGCDDGNVEDGDGCSGACRIELGHGVCDTDEDCVANGRCDAQTHLCVARCTVDGDCDDSNGCTTDSCNLETGVCQVVALAEGASCDDGDFCTSGTTCDAGGVCSGGVTISCSQPTVWTDCQEAVCDESLNMCVEQDRACALDRVYFFGVIRRSGGTLGSIRCWRDAGGIACDMDGNELLVGEPVCE